MVNATAAEMAKVTLEPGVIIRFPDQPDTDPTGWHRYVLRSDYEFTALSGRKLTIKRGDETDEMSTPWFLAWCLPADDQDRGPAVVHDALYDGQGYIEGFGYYTRAEADAILREAMLRVGIPAWKCNVAWAGVRIFGGSHWNKK